MVLGESQIAKGTHIILCFMASLRDLRDFVVHSPLALISPDG
jgi:hypothetical protein